MTWRTLTATPENLELALQAQEALLVVGLTAIPPAPPGSTIDPDSMRVTLYGKRKSDTESELRIAVLYQDIVAATVTWHAVSADAESAHNAVSGTPNLNSLRMIQYGEPDGIRFKPKMMVIYST